MLKALARTLPGLRQFGLSKKRLAALLLLQALTVAAELIGVLLFLPIFELLRAGGQMPVSEGLHWRLLRSASELSGIPLTLGTLLTVSFCFIALRQVFSYLSAYFSSWILVQSTVHVRRALFLGYLYARSARQEAQPPGEIANDIMAEVDRAIQALFRLLNAFGQCVQIVAYFGGLVLLSPLLTFIIVLLVAGLTLVWRSVLSAIKENAKDITKLNARIAGFLTDRLYRARLIRLSGTEKAEIRALSKMLQQQSAMVQRQSLMSARMSALPEPVAVAIGFGSLYFGVQTLGLQFERLALFVVMLIRLMPIVRSVGSVLTGTLGRWGSVDRIQQQLNTFAKAREPGGGNTVFDKLTRKIQYHNVWFHYDVGHAPVLAGINVTIPAHKMTAVIGPSGAGKSTLIDLLPRLRDPTSGRITFDDTPIQDFALATLRAGISYVPQQPQILDVSAAEHIRYGKADATDEEVRRAAQLAGALTFIDALPEDFATRLGEGGRKLSGGQRQRLDIARALVRGASILIMDEPTSSLDVEAEQVFRSSLRKLRSETNLTLIVIAHKLSTIAHADQIVVLNAGRVEAVGTHADLIAGDNWYARAHREGTTVVG